MILQSNKMVAFPLFHPAASGNYIFDVNLCIYLVEFPRKPKAIFSSSIDCVPLHYIVSDGMFVNGNLFEMTYSLQNKFVLVRCTSCVL